MDHAYAIASQRTKTPAPSADRSRRREIALGMLFGLSGVPALIDQVAWQRILALHSGVGTFSVTTIVAAYMAGLGFGSLIGAELSRRLRPGAALAAFALIELATGSFAWFSGTIYRDLPGMDVDWFQGDSWGTAVAHLMALLPPTLLMGMTLPLLVRSAVRRSTGAARSIAHLYGCNLIGAAVGAAVTPWLLIPMLGITGALRFGSVCSLLGALGVLAIVVRSTPESEEPPMAVSDRSGRDRLHTPPFAVWAALYFASGFVAISLEIVWFRIVDVGAKSTAFTFGTVLSIYLVGLAIGSLAGGRVARCLRDPFSGFLACQLGVLLYTGIVIIALVRLDPMSWPLDWYRGYWASYEPLMPGWSRAKDTFALYVLFPMVVFGIPTVLMGVSFHLLQSGVQSETKTSGFKVGLLQAGNIAGCVTGALVVGLNWLDLLGTSRTLKVLVGSGVVLSILLAWHRATQGRSVRPAAVVGVVLTALVLLMPDGEALWARLHGGPTGLAFLAESAEGVAALTSEGGDRWRMSVNGKGQSFLPFGGIHSKLGALPALIHPRPEQIAMIGLGSGDTAWAAACRGDTKSITIFEMCAIQQDLLTRLAGLGKHRELSEFLADRRVRVIEADGRAAIERSNERYDLIEADAIRPNGASSGNLYSVEFFEICSSRLKSDGLICTWAPTPRTKASFRRVFPHVVELDGGAILIGSRSRIPLDPALVLKRLQSADVARYLGPSVVAECRVGMGTARVVQSETACAGEVNTDLDPRDEYRGGSN